MLKQNKRARRERSSAATRRPPEGARLDLYEATVMYIAASRAIEAHAKRAAGLHRPRRSRT
jgi:hypothetical protein